MKNRSDRKEVLFLHRQPALAASLTYHLQDSGSWRLRCATRIDDAVHADVLVVSAPLLIDSSIPAIRCMPSIAYGPASYLRSCYLAGCDDFLKEPWDVVELSFRVERLLSVPGERLLPSGIQLALGNLIGPRGHAELSHPELLILRMLARVPGEVVPRDALHYVVWGQIRKDSRAIDVYVSNIRKKLRAVSGGRTRPVRIRAVRGTGYILVF